MHRPLVLATSLLSALFALPITIQAQACTFKSLTETLSADFSFRPVANFQGDRIAFEADTDGNSFSEIFLYDAIGEALIPLTNPTGADSSPSIDASGTQVAFHSLGDYTGGNPDGSAEIFIIDTTTMTTSQLTSSDQPSSNPALSADATIMAFRSNADFTGDNANASREIFLLNLTTGFFTQVTSNSSMENYAPRISADGSTVVFPSDGNHTGENPAGDRALFVYDVARGVLSQATEPLTISNSTSPSLSENGRFLAFTSRDDLTGQNPNGDSEVYLLDLTTDTLNQVTHLASTSLNPELNYDGTRITFVSDSRFSGGNPETNFELFQLTVGTGSITQLTSAFFDTIRRPALSGDGSVITISTQADLDGTNSDHSFEVFTISNCDFFVDGFESGSTSAWSTTEFGAQVLVPSSFDS